MAQAHLLKRIANVFGLSVEESEVLCDDGYYRISTIVHQKYDKIRD